MKISFVAGFGPFIREADAIAVHKLRAIEKISNDERTIHGGDYIGASVRRAWH